MQKPLGEHVLHLERQILVLMRSVQDHNLPSHERNEREIALANARESLRLYRKAFELERAIKFKLDH